MVDKIVTPSPLKNPRTPFVQEAPYMADMEISLNNDMLSTMPNMPSASQYPDWLPYMLGAAVIYILISRR